jgi:adenylylsulfate kinase
MTGCTVWLTGLPSSGKSTIASTLAKRLTKEGRRVDVLDGDVLRRTLTTDLGYTRADRDENVRRIGIVAMMLARHDVIVLVPVIAPYSGSRDKIRALHEEHGIPFVEVYVATPLAVCAQRDVKGLYAEQRAGRMKGLTGVDDPYEPPPQPDLTVYTQAETVTASVDSVHQVLRRKLLV